MPITLKYQGYNRSKSSDGSTTTQVYIGLEKQIKDYAESFVLNSTSSLGTLQSITLNQDEGPFWTCELQWSTEKDSNGNDIGDGTLSESKMSTLSIRMMSMPLESHPKYRTNWNYILIGLQGVSVPSWWSTETDGDVSDPRFYKWVRDISEIPTQPDSTTGRRWKQLRKKTKGGVECFQVPIYQLTEISRHNSKNSAGWAVAKVIGKIAKPSNGDFGVVKKNGGNWLCEGGSVSYNGKKWQASCTYAHAPGNGWDDDIYSQG